MNWVDNCLLWIVDKLEGWLESRATKWALRQPKGPLTKDFEEYVKEEFFRQMDEMPDSWPSLFDRKE